MPQRQWAATYQQQCFWRKLTTMSYLCKAFVVTSVVVSFEDMSYGRKLFL